MLDIPMLTTYFNNLISLVNHNSNIFCNNDSFNILNVIRYIFNLILYLKYF